MSVTQLKPRPVQLGVEVRTSVRDEIFDAVARWWGNHVGKDFPANLPAWLHESVNPNAYLFAKDFERLSGVTPDDSLVRIFSLRLDGHYRKCVTAWVSHNQIKIPDTHQVKKRVVTTFFSKAAVVAVFHDTAMIGVVPDTYPYEFTEGGNGLLLPFEDAIPIIGTIGEPAPAVGGAA